MTCETRYYTYRWCGPVERNHHCKPSKKFTFSTEIQWGGSVAPLAFLSGLTIWWARSTPSVLTFICRPLCTFSIPRLTLAVVKEILTFPPNAHNHPRTHKHKRSNADCLGWLGLILKRALQATVYQHFSFYGSSIRDWNKRAVRGVLDLSLTLMMFPVRPYNGPLIAFAERGTCWHFLLCWQEAAARTIMLIQPLYIQGYLWAWHKWCCR